MTSTLSTTEAALCARIKVVLETVDNVGNVYERERWAALLSDQREIGVAAVAGERAIRFWTISPISAPGLDVSATTTRIVQRHWPRWLCLT
jgi:hypothetical protein